MKDIPLDGRAVLAILTAVSAIIFIAAYYFSIDTAVGVLGYGAVAILALLSLIPLFRVTKESGILLKNKLLPPDRYAVFASRTGPILNLTKTVRQQAVLIVLAVVLLIAGVGYALNMYLNVKAHNLEVAREQRLCKSNACREEVRQNYIFNNSQN